MLTIGSLFSGIGGLDLGLERAGLGPVVWQCEIDPFCRAVLEKHWPNVTRFVDVSCRRNWPAVDLICGGFPCQDVSPAGKRAGLAGARSGLWWMFAAVLAQVQPSWVVVENVAHTVRSWLPAVRRHLCELGYRTRAFGLSAFDVGAPHRRRRVFVVGRHAARLGRGSGWEFQGCGASTAAEPRRIRGARPAADADGVARREQPRRVCRTNGTGAGQPRHDREEGSSAHANGEGQLQPGGPDGTFWRWSCDRGGSVWTVEPPVCGVAHGVPGRVDRLGGLGNAVVPQQSEVIGRVIFSMLKEAA